MRWRSLVLACAGLASSRSRAPAPLRSRAASAAAARSAGSAWPRASRRASGWRTPPAGWLSDDGGHSFRAPLSTSAFRHAQVAQATLLADGRTLIAMPTVWSSQQFSPPRWSADGGAIWQAGALTGADAHYDFGDNPRLRRREPGDRGPGRRAHSLVLPGQPLRHPRRRPLLGGRDAALQAPVALRRARNRAGKGAHADPRSRRRRQERQARARESSCAASTAERPGTRVKAPRYPQLDYNGHALAFDPAKPSTALMIGAHGTTLGTLYRSTDAGVSWKRVRPGGNAARRRGRPVRVHVGRPRARAGAHRRPPEADVRLARRRPALGAAPLAHARLEVAARVSLAARRQRHGVSAGDEPARVLAADARGAAAGSAP